MGTDALKPRLCKIRQWPDFPGYGFVVHAEMGGQGHVITKVDPGSPASTGGLRSGDRIVEINGTNIGNENQQQVVARIRFYADRVRILVADEMTYADYRQNGRIIREDLPEVLRISTPEENPFTKPVVSGGFYTAKICVLKLWPNFPGFGFSLHAERSSQSHIVGRVEPFSPAAAVGVSENDRIFMVNGVDVLNVSHEEVVQMIKGKEEARLALAGPQCENYLREMGLRMLHRTVSVSLVTYENATPAGTDIPQTVTKPFRLCHMKRDDDAAASYGFTLHANRQTSGHFITEVDAGSPAGRAGVTAGVRLVEVNGINVEDLPHRSVVQLVKAVPDEVSLLVLLEDLDHISKSSNSNHQGENQENIQSERVAHTNSTPIRAPEEEEEELDDDVSIDYRKITDEMIAVAEREAKADDKTTRSSKDVSHLNEAASQYSAKNRTPPSGVHRFEEDSPSQRRSSNGSTMAATEGRKNSIVISGIEFAPSVEEARKRIPKKSRIKDENVSIRDKFRLFQKL